MGKNHLLWQSIPKKDAHMEVSCWSWCDFKLKEMFGTASLQFFFLDGVIQAPKGPTTTTTITLLHYRFTSLLQPLLLGDGIETMEIFIYLCYFFAISFSEHMDGWRILHQSMGTSSHEELRSLVHPRWWMVSAIASIIFARCIGYSIQTGRFCLAHTFA